MTVRVRPGQRPARATTSRPRITGPALLARRASPAALPARGSRGSALWPRWLLPWRRRSRRPSHRSASLASPPPARRSPVWTGPPSSSRSRAPSSPGRPAARDDPARQLQGLLARLPWPGRTAAFRRQMEEAVPEVVDVLRATVAAGINPRRALQAASDGAPPALEGVLGQAIQAAELGAGTGSALATAARAEGLPELALAGEALDLAETTGAPPGPVLAGVAAAAADRIRSRQARMAATAQARLSARVVAAMAPAFLGVLALTAPSDAAFLVREPLGWATLASAAVLELLGIRWATRIVRGSNPMVPRDPRPNATRDRPSMGNSDPADGGRGRARRTRWARGPRLARHLQRTRDPDGTGRSHRMAALATVAAIAAGVLSGAVVVAAAAPGLVLFALLAAVAWPVMGRVGRRRAHTRRLAVRSEAAPAVLDLLGAALLAGLNPHRAVIRVAERAPEALQEDLSLAAAVLRLGGTPASALRAAADRSGLDELRAAAAALEAAERWGAPPAEALAARAEVLRVRARLNAEAEAGRAAVRLAFPLVLCFLPAFVLLTVVPTIAGAIQTLTP
jgi:Flp pilus assembly protein TadB